jgi:hypothetical protein
VETPKVNRWRNRSRYEEKRRERINVMVYTRWRRIRIRRRSEVPYGEF